MKPITFNGWMDGWMDGWMACQGCSSYFARRRHQRRTGSVKHTWKERSRIAMAMREVCLNDYQDAGFPAPG